MLDRAAVNKVFTAALDLQEFCQAQQWQFCFIGGLAVQRWGDPRLTKDADMTLLTGFRSEEKFIDALLSEFEPRRPDLRAFALRQRVVLVRHSSGIPFDIALGGLPFEENSVRRATGWKVATDAMLITCSADDLIVHKAFAGRDLDWGDVERIVMRQGRALKIEQIWSELRPLVALKEEPEILVKLQKIFDQHLD